jgi:hypothetical protein
MKAKSVSSDLRPLWDRVESGAKIYISGIVCLVHAYFGANLLTNLLSDYFRDFDYVQSTAIIVSKTYGCVICFLHVKLGIPKFRSVGQPLPLVALTRWCSYQQLH